MSLESPPPVLPQALPVQTKSARAPLLWIPAGGNVLLFGVSLALPALYVEGGAVWWGILLIGCSSWFGLNEQITLEGAGMGRGKVTAFGPGFYVWLAALIAPSFGSLWQKFKIG